VICFVDVINSRRLTWLKAVSVVLLGPAALNLMKPKGVANAQALTSGVPASSLGS